MHALKIDSGTGVDQKIHSQNTVDLKAIVHTAVQGDVRAESA